MAEWLTLSQVAAHPGQADRPVACCGSERRSHARFVADVRAWQACFAAQAGRRFALYFDDSYDFATALFGAWHAGKDVVLPGDAQTTTLAHLTRVVDGYAGALPGALSPGQAPAMPQDLDALDLDRTRVAIYTSGSSGEPVAIDKRLAQLEAEMHTLQSQFGSHIGVDAVTHATVSHQHIYGLLFHILWPLAAGRPFASGRLDYPEQMAQHLAQGPCLLVSSPAHLRRLPAAQMWEPVRTTLQAVFSSGGPLPAEAAYDTQQRLGHSPIEVFGSSETGGIAWRQRATHADRWQPLPGIEWRIEDELLSVRSPHLAHPDWWLTTDRVQALQEGGFMLIGRADRIVKIEGKRVSLTAIEQALVASGAITEARALLLTTPAGVRLGVVAVPSETGAQQLVRDGRRAFSEHLRSLLVAQVERVALPRRWRYVDLLPINAQGKSPEALLAALFDTVMPEAHWQSRDPAQAHATLDIHASLRVFDGHFPQAPLVPGVAQLDWAIEFGRRCFAMPAHFMRAEALKFQRPMVPGRQVDLVLRWDPATAVLSFVYESNAGLHASGRVIFEGSA